MKTVVLRAYDNYFSANIILTRLQDAGIECFLRDEFTVGIDPILSNAIGGIKLAVSDVDAFDAENLLRSFEADFVRSVACPRCHSHDIILLPKPGTENIFKEILNWFSSFASSPQNFYECQQCGYQTTTLPHKNENFN